MGEHHSPGADADGAGAAGYLSGQYLWAGPSEIGDAVVLGHPVTLVA